MRSKEHYYISLLSLYNFIYCSWFLFALPVMVSFAFLVAKFAHTLFLWLVEAGPLAQLMMVSVDRHPCD